MPLEMYFRDDIERIIAGLTAMVVESCARGKGGDDYLVGALSMARSTALSLGCDWDQILSRLARGEHGWTLKEIERELLTE